MKWREMKSSSVFAFCPYCGSELIEYEILDPFMIGLHCSNDHCFHIEVEQGEYRGTSANSSKTEPIDVAREWLTNKHLRRACPNQIAEVLRKYVDLREDGKCLNDLVHLHIYCPVCRLPLNEFKQDDVWVKGLSCENDHVFYQRHGLYYEKSKLDPDLTKAAFESLVKSYTTKKAIKDMPGQLADLLLTIAQEKG